MTKKFNSEPDAQECDATDVEQCVVAGYKNVLLTFPLPYRHIKS